MSHDILAMLNWYLFLPIDTTVTDIVFAGLDEVFILLTSIHYFIFVFGQGISGCETHFVCKINFNLSVKAAQNVDSSVPKLREGE